MLTWGRVVLTLGILGLPALGGAQSLWREGLVGDRLFVDHRARTVNDIVTIIIVEQSSSSLAADSSTSKDTSRAAGVNKFPTLFDPAARKAIKPVAKPTVGYEDPSKFLQDSLTLDLSGKAAHQGKGAIDRSARVTGQVAARVVKVLPNGNLLIEGRRSVVVNDETQFITISGVVRHQDVTAANTVLSSQIADAEVQMEGRGILSEAQRPGILFRILDWLGLF
jgi:flagellar L-ring protein precursor FlgH